MAGFELNKLSSYELLQGEQHRDIYYVRLTDSLYKMLEDFHNSQNDHSNHGNNGIELYLGSNHYTGSITFQEEQTRYSFKLSSISNKTGLDCYQQSQKNIGGLSHVGTAFNRLIIEANNDVYQSTKEKMMIAEEKKNENQAVMIDNFKNKRKSGERKPVRGIDIKTRADTPTQAKHHHQRNLPNFSKPATTVINDPKKQEKLRDRAIHLLALGPLRKIELLKKLAKFNNGDGNISKILGQIASTHNNMFHLKTFLFNEVQVDTWPEYSDSDRAAIRQKIQIHSMGEKKESTQEKKKADVKTRGLTSSSESDDPKNPPLDEHKATIPPSGNASNNLPNFPKFVKQSQISESNESLNGVHRKKRPSNEELNPAKRPRLEQSPTSGIDFNRKSRKAMEELRLPFVDKVKSGIASILTEYTTIMTVEQKDKYSEDFHRDYKTYIELKQKEDQIGREFLKLKQKFDESDKKGVEVKLINRKTRDLFKKYINSADWCQDKERLILLEAKLSHIKQLFERYDSK